MSMFRKEIKKASPRKEQELGFSAKINKFLPSNPGRFDRFVLITRVPEFPLEHAGVLAEGATELSFHKERGLGPIDTDLLCMGQTTVALLEKQDHSVCPRVIFFGLEPPTYPDISPEILARSEVVKRNKVLYPGHFLRDYQPSFLVERQKTQLFLDIASHGNNERIGSSMYWIGNAISDTRFTPEIFTENLLFIVEDALSGAKYFKPEIHITLHSCNSAYCDFAKELAVPEVPDVLEAPEDDISERDRHVIEDTFIGKVASVLMERGIKGSVSGFRGYYRTLGPGLGAVVSSTPDELSKFYQQTLIDNTKFTINVGVDRSNRPCLVVSRVPNERYLQFPVYFPEHRSAAEDVRAEEAGLPQNRR